MYDRFTMKMFQGSKYLVNQIFSLLFFYSTFADFIKLLTFNIIQNEDYMSIRLGDKVEIGYTVVG